MTITAVEDSTLITWQKEELYTFLKGRPFRNAIFSVIVGKDITSKLYQVQEILMHCAVKGDERRKETDRKSRNSIVQFRHRLSMSVSSNASREIKELVMASNSSDVKIVYNK